MRAMASLLMSVVLLSSGVALGGEAAPLQEQVRWAIAHDLGINPQDRNTHFGMQILRSEMQLPEHAQLRIASVHAVAGANTWLLRMECSSRVECLPFEVALRGRSQDAAGLLAFRTAMPPASGNRLAAALVRAGQRVQLAEEVSGVHLSAPAVSLQAGCMGQRIRVRNVASGRVVLARVRAAGQVTVED